jgi:hypothetical protein
MVIADRLKALRERKNMFQGDIEKRTVRPVYVTQLQLCREEWRRRRESLPPSVRESHSRGEY